ncbi:MAG: acyltransferase [Chloroherpetonaceae bacterium]|nr:acyltransferase [Chloroherpetonaceae bacterium]
MKLKYYLNQHPAIKQWVHRLLVKPNEARPSLISRLIVNPLFHRISREATIRSSVRRDLFPFNPFSIGRKSIIEDFATVNNGVGEVRIGEGSRVGIGNVLIGPVEIGNNCILAQHVVISGLNHGYESPEIPIKLQAVKTNKITIEDDCWIGANVSIAAGVTIGKHSVVGAGSTVTKSIPPLHVAVGNPARLIKRYDDSRKEWVKL